MHICNNAVVHYFVLFIVQISVQKFFFANFFLCNTCAATHLAAGVVIIFNLLSMYVFSCTCAKLYFYTGCPLWNPKIVKVFFLVPRHFFALHLCLCLFLDFKNKKIISVLYLFTLWDSKWNTLYNNTLLKCSAPKIKIV